MQSAARRTLDALARFIRELATESASDALPDPSGSWVSFSRAGLGWLWLGGSEHDRYTQLVQEFVKVTRDRPSLGPRWVADRLQQAMLEALDIVGAQRDVSLDARIAKALENLQKELAKPPLPWEVYLPIGGLAAPPRPTRIGGVVFKRMTARTVGRLTNKKRVFIPQSLREKWSQPKAVAHLKLQGYEADVVNTAARQAVAPVLDILNFYADIAYSRDHPALLYLPGDAPAGLDEQVHVIHNPEPFVSAAFRRIGGLEPFDLAHLKDKRLVGAGAPLVLKLMAQQPPMTPFERRILVALQWAGRATAENRPELSLLLYLISLEALLLGPDASSELSYRLRLRAGHLLGRTPAARNATSDRTRRLYKLRGKIVHAGRLGVTATEAAEARSLTKNAIVAGLRHRALRRLTTEKAVEEWFAGRALR